MADNIVAVVSAVSSLIISSLIAIVFTIKIVAKSYRKVKLAINQSMDNPARPRLNSTRLSEQPSAYDDLSRLERFFYRAYTSNDHSVF